MQNDRAYRSSNRRKSAYFSFMIIGRQLIEIRLDCFIISIKFSQIFDCINLSRIRHPSRSHTDRLVTTFALSFVFPMSFILIKFAAVHNAEDSLASSTFPSCERTMSSILFLVQKIFFHIWHERHKYVDNANWICKYFC